MADYDISVANLLRVFPPVLQKDKKMVALAKAAADQLVAVSQKIDLVNIYTRIDELPEDLLDILAYDFKVDWWDPDYTIEEKRQTLKDSWYVHRHLGTKAAVETAISAVFKNSKVEEWFEYGGEPYHFRIAIGVLADGTTTERQDAVLKRVQFYKNLRSHLDGIDYRLVQSGTFYAGATLSAGSITRLMPDMRSEHHEIRENHYAGATLQVGQNVQIYPKLVHDTATAGQIYAGATTKLAQVCTIWPDLPQNITSTSWITSGGAVRTCMIITIRSKEV